MARGPGLYTAFGKTARGLLYKDFQTDNKFTITSSSATDIVAIASFSSGTIKGGLFFGDLNTQKNVTAFVKADTDSKLSTTIMVDEAAPGLKTTLTVEVPYQRPAKLEMRYLNDLLGVSTSVDLTTKPVLNFTGVIGTNMLALGTEVSFDSKAGKFTKCNVGLSFSSEDFNAALTLDDKGNSLSVSFYHLLNPLSKAAIGGEMLQSCSVDGNVVDITIGAQRAIDPSTMVKARVNSFGKVNALIQHEWRPRSLFTLCAEVDIKSIEMTTKVGLALALNL